MKKIASYTCQKHFPHNALSSLSPSSFSPSLFLSSSSLSSSTSFLFFSHSISLSLAKKVRLNLQCLLRTSFLINPFVFFPKQLLHLLHETCFSSFPLSFLLLENVCECVCVWCVCVCFDKRGNSSLLN